MTQKMRADDLVVHQHLAESKTRAKALIIAGKIWVGTQRVDKPGKMLAVNTPLHAESAPKYVSRGGEKLEAFLNAFCIDLKNKNVLDIGASTGGFTDCMLQRGAASSTCIDVGHGQLHYKLQKDPRVINLEKVNARHLSELQLARDSYDIAVIDVSFISLRRILEPVWTKVSENGLLIPLIKPQFEAEKSVVDKTKGVIQDPTLQESIRDSIIDFALKNLPKAHLVGVIDSPIRGGDGNREFLVGFKKSV